MSGVEQRHLPPGRRRRWSLVVGRRVRPIRLRRRRGREESLSRVSNGPPVRDVRTVRRRRRVKYARTHAAVPRGTHHQSNLVVVVVEEIVLERKKERKKDTQRECVCRERENSVSTEHTSQKSLYPTPTTTNPKCTKSLRHVLFFSTWQFESILRSHLHTLCTAQNARNCLPRDHRRR